MTHIVNSDKYPKTLRARFDGDYAERIAQSLVQGQREQACKQFRLALLDGVNAIALLEDISSDLGGYVSEDVLFLAGTIINEKDSTCLSK